MQASNARTSQDVLRLRSHHAILRQRRANLAQRHDGAAVEISDLEKNMKKVRQDMLRLNALISANASAERALASETCTLELQCVDDLKTLEGEASRLTCQTEQAREDKRTLVDRLVQAEQEVLHLEGKLQMEKDMQQALDPDVGADLIGSLQRDIQRLSLRCTRASQQQEHLILEMERSIEKRDLLAMKASATSARKQVAVNEAILQKALGELEQSVTNTKRETKATDRRVTEYDSQRAALAAEAGRLDEAIMQIQQKLEACKTATSAAEGQKAVVQCIPAGLSHLP